jgi:hypothetical protein
VDAGERELTGLPAVILLFVAATDRQWTPANDYRHWAVILLFLAATDRKWTPEN